MTSDEPLVKIAKRYKISSTRVKQIIKAEERRRWPDPWPLPQHDRHCWMLVDLEQRRITSIEHYPDDLWIFNYAGRPSVKLLAPDWGPYCDAVVAINLLGG